MEVIKTSLEGVLLIKPDVFEDHRGEFVETHNDARYRQKGIEVKFIQDDISVSAKDVLRGIHGDSETCKLVTCLFGRCYLVVVDCNEKSLVFGKWQSFMLTDRTRHQVFIPPMHGVAHLALTDKIIFHYKQSTYYNPKGQFTYRWDDKRFNIWWPVKTPIFSKRDELGHYVD